MPPQHSSPRKPRRSASGKQPPQLDTRAVSENNTASASEAAAANPPSPPLPAFSRPSAAAAAVAAAASGEGGSQIPPSGSQEADGSPTASSPKAQQQSSSSSSLPPIAPTAASLKSPSVAPQTTPKTLAAAGASSFSSSSNNARSLHHSSNHKHCGGGVPSTPLQQQQQPQHQQPTHVKRRVGGTTNIGATVLDSIVTLPKAISHLWRFLFLGVMSCLDKILDLYLLPIRFAVLFQRLTLRHIVLGVFAAVGAFSLMLHPFGEGPGHAFSYWYHLIQGISALKLYVMCNMLEVSERLVANMGGDVLEALWVEVGNGGDLVATSVPVAPPPPAASPSLSPLRAASEDFSSSTAAAASLPTHTCSISTSKKSASSSSSSSATNSSGSSSDNNSTTTTSNFLRNMSLVLAGVLLTSLHSYVIVLQIVVYNVALNGDSYSLIALLASNNFSELRRMVNRKVASDDLFRTACGDVIEQMQLVIFFVVMLLRHSMSSGFGTVEINDLFFILLVEIVIDTMKHTFVIRNNGIKESIYSRYEAVWFWDVARDIFRAEYLSDCKKAMCDPVTALGMAVPQQESSSSAAAGAGGVARHTGGGGGGGKVSRESSVQPAAAGNRAGGSGGGGGGGGVAPPPPQGFSDDLQQQSQMMRATSSTPVMTPLALPPQGREEGSNNNSNSNSLQLDEGSDVKKEVTRSRSNEKKSPTLTESSASSVGASTLPPRVPPLLIPKGHPHPTPTPNMTGQNKSSSSSSVLSAAQHFFRSTIFSTVVEESLLLGYPSRRVGLVTVPYVAVLWWISAPVLWHASSLRLVVWVIAALAACKLLIRAVNRGFAARWVCRARSWGPGRPPPSAISTAATRTGAATVDDLSKQEQQLLEKLDRVQQFRFVS